MTESCPVTRREVFREARAVAFAEVEELRAELNERAERTLTNVALVVYLLTLAGLYFLFRLVVKREAPRD